MEPVEVERSISRLLEMPGVTTADEAGWNLVLERWPANIQSLGDAIVAVVALQGRYQAVATFDEKLRVKLDQQGSKSYWSA